MSKEKLFDDFDRRMMARAVALARRGEGRVEPNPMVGCVVVRNRRVIGEGYHRRFGGPHAEIEALRFCTANPRGATLYVSLEPCCHHGQTPPCSDALIDARVVRVVVAVGDPNPVVQGRGIRRLRAAGIAVETGLLEREAAEVLAPYVTRMRLGRPYVIAKWAQSLDGKLATRTGDSRWISCEASRRSVHRLRARVDAILVGSGTALTDDPMLTARGVPLRRKALRVVLDGRLRLREKCQLVVTAGSARTLVMTTVSRANSRKAERLRRKGVEVIACRTRRGRLVMRDCLQKLAKRDVTNLLVEGGPTILTTLLEARLIDEAFVFTAPMLIGGGDAPTALAGRGAARIEATIAPRSVRTQRSGSDILHRMRFT
ncbi:MAG: bifunctional diaminohydroxyphosphoribosylaminopyrimidine deaminase/5-amino-6-(5-phosphoribosylamino)uracil reductase RibD [Phycisphaerae bacterium]